MSDTRNIIDFYKYWHTDAIKADLDTKRHNFGILCSNIHGDFNLSTCIRNSNAFLAREVYIYGNKKWDRRGAVGTQNYSHIKHIQDISDLPKDVPIISIDNVDNAVPIENFIWPAKYFLMAFGEEQKGIPKEILDVSENIVYITQYGSVRSLNVGCASSIAMYDYCRKLSYGQY